MEIDVKINIKNHSKLPELVLCLWFPYESHQTQVLGSGRLPQFSTGAEVINSY